MLFKQAEALLISPYTLLTTINAANLIDRSPPRCIKEVVRMDDVGSWRAEQNAGSSDS